jgi:hypothetical protein
MLIQFSDEKLHECRFCKRAFKQAAHLKYHYQSHSKQFDQCENNLKVVCSYNDKKKVNSNRSSVNMLPGSFPFLMNNNSQLEMTSTNNEIKQEKDNNNNDEEEEEIEVDDGDFDLNNQKPSMITRSSSLQNSQIYLTNDGSDFDDIENDDDDDEMNINGDELDDEEDEEEEDEEEEEEDDNNNNEERDNSNEIEDINEINEEINEEQLKSKNNNHQNIECSGDKSNDDVDEN